MMTLDEMKLAVCEKLQGTVVSISSPFGLKNTGMCVFRWLTNLSREINWPAEGLQVCREAEKLLNYEQRLNYQAILTRTGFQDVYIGRKQAQPAIFATYEQRLEALCRVWWPERFK